MDVIMTYTFFNFLASVGSNRFFTFCVPSQATCTHKREQFKAEISTYRVIRGPIDLLSQGTSGLGVMQRLPGRSIGLMNFLH